MTSVNKDIEQKYPFYLDRAVVGITRPEFPDFARELIKAIARKTKKSAKAAIDWFVGVFRQADSRWTEAGVMNRRVQVDRDERFARSFHHFRGIL